jgi:hypothetical protein
MKKQNPMGNFQRMLFRLWGSVCIGCAAMLGFGVSCCDPATPVYGILMNDVEETTPVAAIHEGPDSAGRGAVSAENPQGAGAAPEDRRGQ